MNSQSKRDYNNKTDDNNNRRTKAIATAIPMAGIIVAAALMSGPFFL
jgi:predicted hydrolase (HD superfamily)